MQSCFFAVARLMYLVAFPFGGMLSQKVPRQLGRCRCICHSHRSPPAMQTCASVILGPPRLGRGPRPPAVSPPACPEATRLTRRLQSAAPRQETRTWSAAGIFHAAGKGLSRGSRCAGAKSSQCMSRRWLLLRLPPAQTQQGDSAPDPCLEAAHLSLRLAFSRSHPLFRTLEIAKRIRSGGM